MQAIHTADDFVWPTAAGLALTREEAAQVIDAERADRKNEGPADAGPVIRSLRKR